MKSELPHLAHEAKAVEVLAILGEGGSKTVLDVLVNGLRRAVAIPNGVDPQFVRDAKWQRVLGEPEHAALLRNNGLLVNPTYQVEEMSVDGNMTEVLSMEPFSELPFEVFDGKDGSKTWKRGPLSHLENYRDLQLVVSGVSPDIKKLAGIGVSLKSDSISFGFMHDGTMRLFLFDLEGMTITSDVQDELARFYAGVVVNKLDNILDIETGRRFEQQGYDYEARQKLIEQLAV